MERRTGRVPRGALALIAFGSAVACMTLAAGCPDGINLGQPVFNNTTDPSNQGATYVGSAACQACHADVGAAFAAHGHRQELKRVSGAPPEYPSEGTRAGVPDPPAGFAWSDIAYVIGGYTKRALFVNQEGFILTDGATGVNTQWNVPVPAAGIEAGFVPFMPDAGLQPLDFSWFGPRTTGATPQDPSNPLFQDGRPGIRGTFNEAGVQCEACHGPGSNHLPNPSARNIFVDSRGVNSCRFCHDAPFGAPDEEIGAAGGLIRDHEQWAELRASGGHAEFSCTFCHDPHRSPNYDRANAIRNPCSACHGEMNMALHGGTVFTRGGFSEVMSCESCHMPYATSSGGVAPVEAVGPLARVGDTRSHIFRISTDPVDYTQFFTDDGTQVRKDGNGRAALTVDMVCLRCHNAVTLPNLAFTVARAAEIAAGLHRPIGGNLRAKRSD